jgi:hypothetical protein
MKPQILAITNSPELVALLKPEECAAAYGSSPQDFNVDLIDWVTSVRVFEDEGISLGDLWRSGYFPEG